MSRNLALMQKRGWVTVAETSPAGRAKSVTVTDTGVAAFTNASTAWRSAQTSAGAMLGPAAASTLNQWLDLHAEMAARRGDAENSRTAARATAAPQEPLSRSGSAPFRNRHSGIAARTCDGWPSQQACPISWQYASATAAGRRAAPSARSAYRSPCRSRTSHRRWPRRSWHGDRMLRRAGDHHPVLQDGRAIADAHHRAARPHHQAPRQDDPGSGQEGACTTARSAPPGVSWLRSAVG